MFERMERTVVLLTVLIFAVLLIGVVAVSIIGCRRADEEEEVEEVKIEQIEPVDKRHHSIYPAQQQQVNDFQQSSGEEKSLMEIIEAAKWWGAGYNSWFGRMAPDFVVTDIEGKQHRLSDYKGKDVMLVFWATWCGPCHVEIPHLIELRNTVSKEKLVILAISREPATLVKNFVKQQKLNYTVVSMDMRSLPLPFNAVNSIPCSFFIDTDGKIKLATIGVLSLDEFKGILKAKTQPGFGKKEKF